MTFLMVIDADLISSALVLTQKPNQLALLVWSQGLSPVILAVSILLFYVLPQAVIGELSTLLLTIPIFFPVVIALDFGVPKESVAIWFNFTALMTVGFGLIAPNYSSVHRRYEHDATQTLLKSGAAAAFGLSALSGFT